MGRKHRGNFKNIDQLAIFTLTLLKSIADRELIFFIPVLCILLNTCPNVDGHQGHCREMCGPSKLTLHSHGVEFQMSEI